MNQKRITNQILEQTNYTLNSTLNYLFNISNMKKLFSYLLISSMVVLSSCTNYDDQFDDLNTQINTLKSQIEGFSSLSSGLTALQGTVASLQTAIANIPVTPATDVSGLATAANLTALDTALTTLAAEVDAIKTALAGAATSAEVAALQANLTTAQADLAELLAQSNIYAPTNGTLTVSTQSELDFALALGDKVSIINGGVTITHTQTMSDADVATLVGRMVSVTGDVIYTASVSSTVAGVFTKLTGAKNLTLSQPGDISLPAFVSTTALSLTGGDLTTSVSLPALTHVASGLGALSFPKATSVDLSALTAYDGAISITTSDAGAVDLSAFSNLTTTVGAAATTFESLTIVNASSLKAPLFAKGEIVADGIASVDLPKWQSLSASSSFAKAKTAVLPAVDPGKAAGAVIAINSVFPKANSVHIIAAASTKTSVKTTEHMDVTSNSTNLDTLILGGTFSDITISAGADLTSLTFDGSALNVSITGTDLASIDIPYTSLAKGSLTIKDNLDLASVTASKVNGLTGLTITGNTELSTISFAALKTAGAAASVDISGNDLIIENVQQASATGVTPVVAKKITSADFSPLKAYFDAAIAAATATAGSGVKVIADDVLVSTSAAGVATNNPTTDHTIINYDLNIKSNATSTGAVARVNEFEVTGASVLTVNGFVSSAVGTTSARIYELEKWASDAANVSGFTTAGVTVSVGKGNYVGSINHDAAAAAAATDYYELTINGSTVTGTTGVLANGDAVQVAYMAAVNAALAKKANAEFTVAVDGSDASKTNFTGGRKGSNAAAFTIANWGVWEDVSKLTPVAMTATIVAANQPTTTGYIRVVSNAAGTDGAITSSITNATPIAISGPNTAASATLDDGASVVEKNGTSTASTVSAETIAAARIDMTAFL
ncbi:hypothetical protein OAG00_03355 [Flavobacteriaceae bacterium]|nr:hypothetical protein [Flavobacteriaceae bacterium]